MSFLEASSAERNRRLRGWVLLLVFVLAVPCGARAKDKKSHAQESLERRQKIELLGFFLKDPKDAKLPQTPIAIQLFNQGVNHFEKKEYDLALEALNDSLKYNPGNSLAYELIGDIYYYQQKLGAAKEQYKKAFELQPRDGLKNKMKKLRQEAIVEKDLSTYREQHFLIKYHGENKAYEGFELRELLRKTYGVISRDFGYYFKHKVVVLLYDEKEFQLLTQQPHWVAGLYDGKIRLPAYKRGFTEGDLRALTAHEMAHAFVAVISSRRAPVWIHEGLAEYEENKVRKISMDLFESAVKTKTLMSLDQLMMVRAIGSIKSPLMVSLFYQQSFHLVSYLIDRYGMFRIKKLLEEFGTGKNSDEAIRAVLRISTKRLEREWKETF